VDGFGAVHGKLKSVVLVDVGVEGDVVVEGDAVVADCFVVVHGKLKSVVLVDVGVEGDAVVADCFVVVHEKLMIRDSVEAAEGVLMLEVAAARGLPAPEPS
jgi:hypothetical protein